MRPQIPGFCYKFVLAAAFAIAAVTTSQAQSESDFRPDAPDRYVVKKGDTLWGLANRFLRDPWRWPLIWSKNRNIENPDLIYPGDLVVVTGDNSIKVVRLKPKVRREPLDRAIPAIPPNIIQPFLTTPIITEPGELEQAGYVLGGVEGELLLGKYQRFYARNITSSETGEYRIFRIGSELKHPESGEFLGIEGIYLGASKMLEPGEDVSKLVVLDASEVIHPGDRLWPLDDDLPLPYFQPSAPPAGSTGWILRAPKGVLQVGRYDVVIVSGGTREGLKQGHVLRILYHRGARKDFVDGTQFEVPDEESGFMMIFRVFEKVSYALILKAVRPISIGDKYESP